MYGTHPYVYCRTKEFFGVGNVREKTFPVCPCLGPIFLVWYAQHTRRTACPIRRGMSIKGAFLVCMAQIIVKHSYPKTWIDHDAQVERLIQRGLEVADKESAKRILAYANYYRFTGYCLPFQHVDSATNERVFNSGTSFADVWALYQKDRELRDCISSALETVEISFRSSLAYFFAKSNGAFGHLNPANFISKFTARGIDANGCPTRSRYEEWHDDLLKETQRSNELFVKHFSATYSEFPDLPIWTASEICSFGTLSKMFASMLRQDMREIAINYHLQASILDSWIHSFVYVRNVCAHHSRLWDKVLAIAPQLPPGKLWDPVRSGNKRLYCIAMTLNWMLAHDSIDQGIHLEWKLALSKLIACLFARFPKFQGLTGFPHDWENLEVWKSV